MQGSLTGPINTGPVVIHIKEGAFFRSAWSFEGIDVYDYF